MQRLIPINPSWCQDVSFLYFSKLAESIWSEEESPVRDQKWHEDSSELQSFIKESYWYCRFANELETVRDSNVQ
jgi:hypothetical protein